ncbi:hypothetical protein [Lysinibacillus sp. NPDC093688]|uniref:hypothetical protein n=1 Tax=Lysinibacillus sp. NPDC093688 TaxID=3390577 RepID=UPI003CFD8473
MLTTYELYRKVPVFRDALIKELQEEGIGKTEQLLLDKYPEDYKKLKEILPLVDRLKKELLQNCKAE